MDEIQVSNKTSNSNKSNLFSHLLSLLLSVHPLPTYVNLVLHIFSEVQIIALLIFHIFDHFGSQEDQDAVVRGTRNLTSAFTFQFNYDFSGKDHFTNAVAIVIGIYFLLVFLIALALITLNLLRQSYGINLLAQIWSYISSLHLTACFLFIQFFALSLLKNLTQENSSLTNKFASKHGAIGMIAAYMTLNILFGLITARFKSNKIRGQDLMATRTAWFAILGLIYKLAISICLSQITNDKVQHWCDFLIGVVFLTSRFYQYVTEIPFYNYRIFKAFLAIAAFQQIELVLGIFWLLISIKREVSLTMILYSFGIFGALFIHISFSYLHYVIRKISLKSLESENEFFVKLFAWERLIKVHSSQKQDEYTVLFNHLVEKHGANCLLPDCGCKYILFQKSLELGLFKNSQTTINLNPHKLYYELIKDLYEEGIKSIERNSLIKLQFANFLIKNDENGFTNAIYLVNTSANSKYILQTFELETMRSITLSKIENQIENTFKSQTSGLQIKQFVDYYIQKSIFRKEIAENTKLYIDFWTAYNKPNPVIRHLLLKNIEINRKADKLKVFWENLITNHARFCHKEYLLNALYMQLIRNAPYTADLLFSRYEALYESELGHAKSGKHDKETFNNQRDVFICVSLNQENFTRIVFASQNVIKMGYRADELKNNSAAILMPLFFAKKHSKFLLKEITENRFYNHLNKEILVFVREKEGYIRPAMLYLTVFPYLKKGFYCLARIRLQSASENYLFMLPNGKIEGGTREISRKLNLHFNQEDQIGIFDICHAGHRFFEQPDKKMKEDVPANSTSTVTKISNFTELMEQNEEKKMTGEDDNQSIRYYSSFHRNVKSPSRFQKQHQQHENSPRSPSARNLRRKYSTDEDDEERPGTMKIMFFPYRNTPDPQGRMRSCATYLTNISVFTHENQNLFIIQLTEQNPSSKQKALREEGASPSGWVKERFNAVSHFANLAKNNFEDEELIVSIPNEVERNQEIAGAMSSPRMGLLALESPRALPTQERTLQTQERFLNTESDMLFTKRELTSVIQKGEYEDNLKTERRKLVENIEPMSEETSNLSRMNARMMRILMRVEKAIHQNHMPVSYKLVKISVIGFILLSIFLFAYYQIEGNRKFDLLVSNMDILGYSLTILYYVNECTRSVTLTKLIDVGYVPRNRNGGGVFDWWLINNFGYIVPNLTNANNKLRESVSYFNEDQRNKFYELIPVIQQDKLDLNPKQNAFDIHTQLISSGLKLYKALPTIPSNDNPDLNFIFNNTINDLLIHDQEIFSLLQEEDKRIVNAMANFVLSLLGIMVGTGIVVIVVLIRNEVNFIKKKMLFFDHFLRIKEKSVRSTIFKSTRFYEALKNSNYSEVGILAEVQGLNVDKTKSIAADDDNQAANNQHQFIIKRKKASLRSINKDSWIGVLTLMTFIFWFWLAYSILYLQFKSQGKATQEYKTQIIGVSLYLSHFSQALLYLYVYVGGLGDIKVLGKPTSTAWEENYKELIQFNGNWTDMMNTEYDAKYDKTIKTLLNGDICALVVNTAACYNDGKGTKLQGIIGMNNYDLNSMVNLKEKYDLSDKSEASIKAIYADTTYPELERIYYSSMMPSYQKLQIALKEVFLLAVSDFRHIIFTLNAVWLVTFLAMGVVYWNLGLKRMEREKIYFRAILRAIPVQVIMSNKFLQHYMMNDSKQNFYF